MNNSGVSPTSCVSMETPSDLFKDLWAQLKECHDTEVQGLQVKVNKLKKDRCLDAQRLEEFYNKNQQLREHQKTLQDNVKVLEDRLRAGLCDRCAVTEEHTRRKQAEFECVRQQNLHLITELMNERNGLLDENKKLSQEVEQLRILRRPQTPSPHPEEGVIPDSPVPKPCLTTVNKMRRKKDSKHMRFAEKPAPLSGQTLRGDEPQVGISSINSLDPLGKDVLVADTCEMEVSQITKGFMERCRDTGATVVAETCQMKVEEEDEEEESQSVFGSFTTTGTFQAREDSQKGVSLTGNDSPRQSSTSPNFSRDKEWLLEPRTSPVFGRSAKPFKHPENRLPPKPGPQDTPQIAPIACNLDRPAFLNGEKAVAHSARDQLALRRPGRESRRGREADDGESGVVAEKPLDLSDRVLGGHQTDRQGGALCKDRPRLGTQPELQKKTPLPSGRSPLALLMAENGDHRSDTDGQGLHKHTAVFKLPSTPPRGKTVTQQLFDIQTPGVYESIGKMSRVESKDSEKNSVLQLNPCSRVKRSISQEEDGKPAVTDDSPWVLEPGVSPTKHVADSPTCPELGLHRQEGETVDMDCTFVSQSMLVKGLRENGHDDLITGIGQKANDSLVEIFDRSAYGEYESGLEDEGSDLVQEEHHEEEEDEPLDMSEEEAQSPPNQAVVKPQENHNERTNASFAHVEVVRKKEERKKLKGHTCKECEIYYADLPESERQKKLSACSRHRFRYIPPSTPEHFWEVGFPSTQTCVQRGYIIEDDEPDLRMRRRRPYKAIFSPKGKQQKT
ncbi:DNA endonuclease RBBP8 [Anguilla anguilla]|uniref:DNA endonuclease RBBP8 n=1 Tax=Anguilla anguilla TaxID=7936 RepID=UPI0015B374B0|nr:DNA endonuclease RBBP8 [Anguilla anguilla]XP_035268635.1 DNA endonuclease RBBP8 [Anguilla anguilla]XP_035268636.1 DNA endonuclease RBBP8 [Anguilla anguilla]XP_035268637.1 DNA endonuclease RBBP8 [Anguilla anguilla]